MVDLALNIPQISYLSKKNFFVHIQFLINKQIFEVFTMSLLVSSENVMYIQDGYIVISLLRKCKGLEISNKTMTMILCGSANLPYVDIVRIALNLST